MKPSKFSRIIEDSSQVDSISEIIVKMSKIQDIHSEVIQQVAVNQYSMSSVQKELALEVDRIKNLGAGDLSEISIEDIERDYSFHKIDDDDIFH
tara:strand:+ start:176 stop:457 length:282 start_codon:yes stop_codon:yes gene_type:complete